MKKLSVKKLLLVMGSVVATLLIVLVVHIYLVTRPKPADANTRIMARIDFRQDINEADAATITEWLYTQYGVDHVLCNPESNIAVFTFRPVKTNADAIIGNLRSSLHYDAVRFMPSTEDLKSGCPVATNSITYKVYKYFKNI